MDGFLCPFGTESNQAVNVVERIEEEMRIQLAFQVLQFGFGTALLQFAPHGFYLVPAAGHLDGNTQASHQRIKHGVDCKEADDIFPSVT